ncbi:MAG TPA: DUF885 family protein [Gemmatimonadaceae bacterium]|nr:DUF885 family protein [Gemmatimonadaceae bacterium]
MRLRSIPIVRSILPFCLLLGPARLLAQRGRGGTATAADSTVPANLRSLLAPRRSEMRLVIQRYANDHTLLAGNYADGQPAQGGGGRGGGGTTAGGGRGRGGADSTAATTTNGDSSAGGGRAGAGRGGRGGISADSAAAATPLSKNRIARLERFNLSWQAALDRVDATKLSATARKDLDSLKAAIRTDQSRLDTEAAALALTSPLMPFGPDLVGLIEARIRIEDMDAEKTAGVVDHATREIAAIRARVNVGIGGADSGVTPLRVNREQVVSATVAIESLRANLANWFTFYNGYDPLFTWWMNLPYKHLDEDLHAYSTFLRDKLAPSTQLSPAPAAAVVAARVEPAAARKFEDVPNLDELIALPQDEMSPIVERFIASGATAGRGVGGGGRGNGPAPTGVPTRDAKFFQDWLAGLKTLDFDHLSRNAQVDYLYLKKVAELQLDRVGKPLPANPPRKADKSGIPGPARGREGLIRDLQDELIPYTPEQLIALAEREFAWCEAEMRRAAREMGLGDDWKAALEKTKTMHPPPGGQPAVIRDLIHQAIDYLRANDLVTVPAVDAESQRMIMMTPERQIVNPFFTGGNQISVSYPTNTMEYEARQQSMRGNNVPQSHATAFHEMMPGHNLVGYMAPRMAGYRANLGATGPFFGEGWAVYWELILYDRGFDPAPEDRVGALFWRMHRCARIIFSLKFHLGQWSPQEAVDFLVERGGHERATARAEVLRSFQGGYGPLYQAAYLLGAMQLRGLRREIVDTKQMSERAFHDEILRQGSMPITLLRLGLSNQQLTRDMSIDWKFDGERPATVP